MSSFDFSLAFSFAPSRFIQTEKVSNARMRESECVLHRGGVIEKMDGGLSYKSNNSITVWTISVDRPYFKSAIN